MEVRVDTYVEHMEDGMRRPINRAYFTMVALDEDEQTKASAPSDFRDRSAARGMESGRETA